MKKYIIYLLLLTCSLNAFSQARVTSSGIAIQGIARTSNNAAITNNQISVQAEIYSVVAGTNYSIISQTGIINTDNAGIFAYVVNIDSSTFLKIANTEAYIKISANNIVFANEKLYAVPYAIHAQNGVPTGSIMAYAGDVIPKGWLLADGSAIPNDDFYSALRAIYGTHLPNLKGMFLRGQGAGTTYTGPNLKSIDLDVVRNHVHAISYTGGTTSTNGAHTHGGRHDRGGNVTLTWTNQLNTGNNGDERWLIDTWTSAPNSGDADVNGNHTHTLSGSGVTATQSGGLTETRPVNYGVNFIIKI